MFAECAKAPTKGASRERQRMHLPHVQEAHPDAGSLFHVQSSAEQCD